MKEELIKHILSGARLNTKDAYILYKKFTLPELSWLANQICQQKYPQIYRTYCIDRNINYTNICISACKFCAFYCNLKDEKGYVLSTEEILKKIDEAVKLGATQIMLQGGLHPSLKISYFEELFRAIKTNFKVDLHSLSAPEIVYISKNNYLDIPTTLSKLKDAGLDSIPGGGAEILVDEVRQNLSPVKCSANEWKQVMIEASKLDMKATSTMVIGLGETINDRILHLDKIREIQDDCGVFTAFIPWTFAPKNTKINIKEIGAVEYLRTLAISRLYLDNITNIQASLPTQGKAIAQLALQYGANDMGGVMLEENVVKAAGVVNTINELEMISLIENAGYVAAKRDTYYNLI